jgi:aromatic ring-opening dioxygenase catalytic subunit (LigB family)
MSGPATSHGLRQPAVFVSHGGGPCFWMDFPPPLGPGAFDKLRAYLAGLVASLPQRPRAVVVVTAHWETQVPTVSAAKAPPMLFDYYGFPAHTYQLSYPAPGEPEVAARVARLLSEAGIAHEVDTQRGLDHGVFVPMLIVDAPAEIPVVMLSILRDFDPARHIALGRALAPLRDENVLILGSGNTWHGPMGPGAASASEAFEDWVLGALTQPGASARQAALQRWESAPYARAAQRREDHLMPLLVVAGAGHEDPVHRSFLDKVGGLSTSCYRFE